VTNSSELATYRHIPSEQTTVLEVVLNNDIRHCIEHKLDVVGVCSTREVSVYLFLVLPFVQILKLQLDICCSFFVSVRTLKTQCVSIKSIPQHYTTALYLQIKKCEFSMRGSDNSIIHTEVSACIMFLLTCIFWKANSQGTLCYFVLKQILFIQK